MAGGGEWRGGWKENRRPLRRAQGRLFDSAAHGGAVISSAWDDRVLGWGRRQCGGRDGFAVCDGDLLDGAEEVFSGGMGEAVAQEVGAHGFVHGVAADEAFESGEEGGGFAVGDAAVGF